MTFDATDMFNLGWVGARQEATYGVRNGAGTTRWPGIMKSSPIRRVPKLIPLGGIRDSRLPAGNGHLEIRYMEEVDLQGQIQNPWPFYAALGKISTTGGPAYAHAISVLRGAIGGTETYLPSFTLEALYSKAAATQVSVLGGVAKTLTCNFPLDDVATFVLNMVGQSEGAASTAPTESTKDPYGSYNTKVLIDSTNGTYTAGSEVKGLNSVDFTFDNNLLLDGQFNSTQIRQPIYGPLRDGISGQIVRKYLDTDLTALADGTPFSMQLQLVRNAVNDYVNVTIENIIADPLERSLNFEDKVATNSLRWFAGSIKVDGVDANSAYT